MAKFKHVVTIKNEPYEFESSHGYTSEVNKYVAVCTCKWKHEVDMHWQYPASDKRAEEFYSVLHRLELVEKEISELHTT